MNAMKRFKDRRHFLKMGAIAAASWLGTSQTGLADSLPNSVAVAADLDASSGDPDAALRKLMAGNQRFMLHLAQHPDQSSDRLRAVAQAQHPFATILSCADSRVPAEIIFDQGIGDIFDVRVAGNIVIPEVLGSIEYAVALLGTPVLMVLGHERCGAVTAAVKQETLPGEIGSFVKAILPALDAVKDQPGDAVENGVGANVLYQMEQLQRSPLLTERLQSGQLKMVGGRYDLDTGRVTLIA